MKKIIAALMFMSSLAFAGTPTTRIGMDLIDDGITPWGDAVRSNYNIIDASVAVLGASNTFTASTNFNVPPSVGAPGTVSSVTFQSQGNLGGGISIEPAWTTGIAGVIESNQQINFSAPTTRFLGPVTASYGVTSSTIALSNTSSSYNGITVVSSGSANSLKITDNGVPSTLQSLTGGAVNITVPVGTVKPALVIVSSNTDAQQGAGILEIWQESINHNDPHIWIHAKDHQSAGNIRIDSDAPNFELVNTSTVGVQSGGTASGTGKWEPFAVPYQSWRMQAASSRCWDNTSFENMMYWEPMFRGGGMYLQAFDTAGCDAGAGYDTTSHAQSINWFEGDGGGNTVGLQGPQTVTASWTFRLPSTFSNGGQVLYQATGSAPRNWEFTVNGSTGAALHFNSTTGAPYWGTSVALPNTSAEINLSVPGQTGVMRYCSDCATVGVCVSTGTTAIGAYALITNKASRCQ